MAGFERALYEVPDWGVGEVWVREGRLLHHVVAGEDGAFAVRALGAAAASTSAKTPGPTPPRGAAPPPGVTLSGDMRQESDGFVSSLCRRFAAHLAGKRTVYDEVAVELDAATPFEEALLATLRAVPWGEVITYGELATLAGRPGAARAAGSFCAAGGLGLVVPYHRVVAANGLGGFGTSGVAFKRRLLAAEGVAL